MKQVMNFDIEVKFPDESVPLYTAQDYMRDTDNGNRTDYDRLLAEAEARGQGFGFTYMRAVEKSVKENGKAWGDYNRVRMDAAKEEVNVNFDQVGKLLNTVLDSTYRDVASDMQIYLAKKGGVIDCWPDPDSASTFDFYNVRTNGEKNDTTKVGINYFAPQIQESKDEDGTHYYRSHEPCYRNKCVVIKTPDMISMDKRLSNLKSVRTYKKGEKFNNNFAHIIAAFPLILAIIAVLLMVFWRITGTDVDAFMNSIRWDGLGKVGTALMFIPSILLMLIALIYKFLTSTVALVIGAVVILVLGIGGFSSLCSIFDIREKWISGKAVKRGKDAQNEIQFIENSDEYKRIVKENADYYKSQREFSEKWHRKWFERVKGTVYFMKNA